MNRCSNMLLAAGLLGACGGGSEFGGEGTPFGGREIVFRSQYVVFPSDFAITIVRDSLPQEEICPLLKKYKVPLPSRVEHYSLILSIQSAMAGDDVTVDMNDRGPAGDMRSIGLGLYPIGAQSVPPGGFGIDAGGTVRLTELVHYERVAGSYNIKFRSGETLSGPIAATACPP